MKLLGANDDMNGGRGPSSHRSQDDAAVGYVFQRHPHETADFPHFSHKQTPQPPRWASGDETIIDNQDKWKYNGPMNSSTISAIGGGISMQSSQQQSHQVPPNTIGKPPSLPQMLNPSLHQQMQNQQDRSRQPTHQMQNHLGVGPNMNHGGLSSNSGMPTMQMPPSMQSSSGGIYDHMQPSVNINGVNMSPKTDQQQNQMLQSQHLNALPPQNQFLQSRNTSSINTSAAKKLWEKSSGVSDMKLTPLQLHGGPEQVWRDSTWSTQGEAILAPPRRYPHDSNSSAGILSPRDSTGGLGVKMVEYVLGGSPTNKESPLSNMESRLRGLKFDENDKSNDDKEKGNSPFDTNGLKKDEVSTNGGMNGIDDDKGFNRTPGSRQPSPADETIGRPQMLLDPTTNNFHQQHFQHMLNTNTSMDMPYHPQLHHQMQGPVMNGGLQVPQQNSMVNQPQGHNSMDSSAALLQQQQHNFDVQQLFRSQNPSLASNTGVAPPGQPTAQPPIPQTLPLPSQQYLAQQSAAYAAATQQPTPYVINPGQDATRYIEMGLIPAGMPQYYGVAPWGMYPANLIPQQNSQPPPRRPLTPSQQAGENQPPYQMIQAYYDQSGSLLMGPRTGTPMRLVSPAPVLVPPGAQARAPINQSMYPPQPQTAQQNLYSQQNGSSVGGLALNTSSLTARRDSFDRNTSAFSPSLDFNSSAVAAVAAANGNGTASRKWPVNNYGGMSSVSPLAPGTPPPTGLGALVSNRAPGAETKYRNVSQLAPVGLSTANTIFGSSNSLFSKIPGTVPVTVSAAPGVTSTRSTTATTLDRSSGRSRLLEDFRNQRYPNLQLRDLTNHIVEFSQDQHGSRFIQQKLERATAAEKQLVFNEILSSAYSLMTDVFGNYVIQKFFEFGTPEQKSTLAQQVKGHVLPLALQMYGCRVIQKALESIPSEQQQEIVRELDGHVLKCVKDQNGNHVVQKCIECVEPVALQFIINAFSGQVYTLSTHPYGCRVIQRILEHCTPEQTAPILAELHAHTKNLIQDQYGNYVIQHVLEHGKAEDKSVLIASVRGKVLELSQHKFASNVVEKCVTHATRAERAFLIEEVCQFNDNVLHVMMKDQYANYVVQKMIDVSEPTQRKILMHKIRPHMNSLRKYTYGKHIIAKLEKFFMTKSTTNAITTSATAANNGSIGNSVGNAVSSLNSSLTTNASTSSVSGSVVVGSSIASDSTPPSNLGPIGPPTTSNGAL